MQSLYSLCLVAAGQTRDFPKLPLPILDDVVKTRRLAIRMRVRWRQYRDWCYKHIYVSLETKDRLTETFYIQGYKTYAVVLQSCVQKKQRCYWAKSVNARRCSCPRAMSYTVREWYMRHTVPRVSRPGREFRGCPAQLCDELKQA